MNTIAKLLTLFALLATPVFGQGVPSQWQYGWNGNNAQATYPGQVAIPQLGTLNCLGTANGLIKSGVCNGNSVSVLNYGASGSAQTTTGTISATSNSLSLASALDFSNGQGILVQHAGPAVSVGLPTVGTATPTNRTGTTTYSYEFASVDAQGGVSAATSALTTTTGYATLGYNTNTDLLSAASINLTWTVGSGSPLCTAIWRKIGTGSYTLLGCFQGTSLNDQGIATFASTWIPATPPAAALSDWLATSITAGGGTSTLTLAATAGTSATATVVQHDDTFAVVAAIAANTNIFFPCGTYNVRTLQTNNVVSIVGSSKTCSTINGLEPNNNGLNSALSVIGSPTSSVTISGLNVVAAMPMAFNGMTLYNGIHSFVYGNSFNGLNALVITSSTGANVMSNSVTGWWNIGIQSQTSSNTLIMANDIGTYSGAAVGYPLTTLAGGAYAYGYGIESENGANTRVVDNYVSPHGAIFGIGITDTGSMVSGNYVYAASRECINLTGNVSNGKVSGNYCEWNSPNNGNTSSYDFGMSVTDNNTNQVQNVDLQNNSFFNPSFSGIGIVGNGGSASIVAININGNSFYNPIDAVSPYTCAIELMGANVSNISVANNIVYDFIGHMTYTVCESNAYGTGYPSTDKIGLQGGNPGISGTVSIQAASSVYLTRPAQVVGPSSY